MGDKPSGQSTGKPPEPWNEKMRKKGEDILHESTNNYFRKCHYNG